MSASTRIRRPRLTTVRRDDDRVSPLELFFDLVFVLALTQCTALMAHEPTWTGLVKGLAILAVMWWAWVGYTWLCSAVDPEEGSVRLAMFTAMAALLVVALAIPDAFGENALVFAIAYGVVRGMQVALLVIAGRDDPGLRHSATGLVVVDRDRRRAAHGGLVHRRRRCRARCGRSRSCSTSAARW